MGKVRRDPVRGGQIRGLKRGREGEASRPGGAGCCDAAHRILDHKAIRRLQGQAPASLEKDVRRRLLANDIVAVDDRLEHPLRQSDLAQVRHHLHLVRARSDGDRKSATTAGFDEFAGAGKRQKAAANHPQVDLVKTSLVTRWIERYAATFGSTAQVAILAHPDEGPEVLRRHGMPLLREELDRGFRQERLGDREHPIEVENHATKLTSFHFDARAIVFDLDGVLVDTMPSIRAAWTRWAMERGIRPEEVLASIHMTGVELIRRFAPGVDPLTEARRISSGQARSKRALKRFDGALEIMTRLPADAWAIVTSARLEPALRHLAAARLPVPQVLITAELTPRGKPDPSGYRLAAEQLGIAPAECLAIEDSPAGLRAALDAGMTAIGVTNTHTASELSHAHAVIASLADLEIVLRPGQNLGRMSIRRKDRIEHLDDPA